MTWDGSADVLPFPCGSNGRGLLLLLWLLLLISARLLLRNEWRRWFLKFDLFKWRVFRIVQNLWRNNCWPFIILTSNRSRCSCYTWMVISPNWSANSTCILIKRLITVLNFTSLVKLILHLVHIFLWSKIAASRLLLHPKNLLIFITFKLSYLWLIYAFSELLICYFTILRLALKRSFASSFAFGLGFQLWLRWNCLFDTLSLWSLTLFLACMSSIFVWIVCILTDIKQAIIIVLSSWLSVLSGFCFTCFIFLVEKCKIVWVFLFSITISFSCFLCFVSNLVI